MTHIVSYKNVPIERGLAFTLYLIDKHGGHIDLFSACRDDSKIREHNREFGTHLKGQAELVHLAAIGEGNPANSPSTTSHCRRSDGNHVYRVNGRQIPSGGLLPWYMRGIDLSDHGKVENVTHFLKVAHELGLPFVQPYPVGGERHHVVLTRSPISVLERRNVISKARG